ncbi:ArsA family ATPase [Gordonia zhaorongruii]|uniref:ArsA family ATPase n=1 Tax=Gordonia zhaorongruii TaxID=2597659 RepID=UPI00104EA708|nr:ArsA family ATPase [Gordonia zhaorongruii]
MVFGPGGSGVSVLVGAAALTDVDAPSRSRSGPLSLGTERDTLIVTLDPHSYLPARLGVFRVPGDPVAVTADVDLLHLDQLSVVEKAWAEFTAALTAVGSVRNLLPVVGTLSGVAPGEIVSLPGAQEFLMLRRIRDAATSGVWRRIIVDMSGVGDPHALLRAPALLSTALERLWPRHARLAEAAEKPAVAQLSAAVEGIDRDCQDLTELFTDPHSVAGHLVLDATDRGRRAAPDQLAVADLTGLPLRSVLVSAGESGGSGATVAVADRVRELLIDDPMVDVREIGSGGPLDRLSRLRKLSVRLPVPSGRPRGSAALTVDKVSGEGVDSAFELGWRQGLPDPDQLELGRSGDDLLVTVSGFRQPVRLPPVLRRCRVSGAGWENGRLVVGFSPDPAVWPQGQGGTTS